MPLRYISGRKGRLMPKLGLGRRFSPDPRDHTYPVMMRLKPSEEEIRTYRYWNPFGWWGDQGQTSQCVAYAWTHWAEDGPVTQPGNAARQGPIVSPEVIYHEAQLLDEWPGTEYDGTSVRAGAKALKARGFISAYHWARTLNEVISTILQLGPMVVGTNWYESMFSPDESGLMSVSGEMAGGHAWVINGVNVKHGLFRMKNSWGRGWGLGGMALISFEDFERLLREDGEACIAQEVKQAA